MIVTRDEARRIALLARLAMDDTALDRMAREMTTILDYIDQLRAVDVSAVVSSPAEAYALRQDEAWTGSGRDGASEGTVAANAPAWREGLFVVPKVIGGE